MCRRGLVVLFLACLMLAPEVQAQRVAVDNDKHTLSVTVREKVEVEPQLAIVSIGYVNQAATKDEAYAENLKAAEKIVRALLDSGVPRHSIETQSLQLAQQTLYGQAMEKREFEATQKWRIHVRASDAQHIVEIATAAGVNTVDEVEWTVEDPAALEARANAAAVAKAKALAQDIAKAFDIRLGELLHIRNALQYGGEIVMVEATRADYSVVPQPPPPPPPRLQLFPEKVKHEAELNVVFAFEPSQEKKP